MQPPARRLALLMQIQVVGDAADVVRLLIACLMENGSR
jgi:hypothetical protein